MTTYHYWNELVHLLTDEWKSARSLREACGNPQGDELARFESTLAYLVETHSVDFVAREENLYRRRSRTS